MNPLSSSSYKVKADEGKGRNSPINLVGYVRRKSDGIDHSNGGSPGLPRFDKAHAKTQTNEDRQIFNVAAENPAFQSEEDDVVRIAVDSDRSV